jgi:hypothetical protein
LYTTGSGRQTTPKCEMGGGGPRGGVGGEEGEGGGGYIEVNWSVCPSPLRPPPLAGKQNGLVVAMHLRFSG